MTLLDEMVALGHGHDWTDEMRRRYGGMTRESVHAALGKPDSASGPISKPVDAYRVGQGQLELTYQADSGQLKLAQCHLL